MSGCLLLNWSAGWLSDEGMSASDPSASKNVLGKIPTSRTAVVLEIVFVERPLHDPLLGPLLWDEVDQIGSLPPADRAALAQVGFRVGRVGANPPQALQTLMGLATELTDSDEKRLVGRRVVLPSGAETEINTGTPQSLATINVPVAKGMELKSYENVRGVFRMKAKRLQDGWARIEFLPELHHGRVVSRPTAERGTWHLQTAQAIERLYRHKFSLDLNMGEMVVITAEMEANDSLGQHFFHSSDFTKTLAESVESKNPEQRPGVTTAGIQRLLIVRLADLNTAESLYSE